MGRASWTVGMMWTLLCVGGCGEEELPIWVEGGWQLRCPAGLAGCRDGEPHRFLGYADELEAGQYVSCAIGDAGGGRKTLSLSLRDGGDSLRLTRVAFDPESGAVSGCRLVFEDADNRYEADSTEGSCGSGPASADGQRCQVQVRITPDADPALGDTVDVSIRCLSVEGPANPGRLQRNVLAVRGSVDEPAFLRLANCSGS